MEHRLVRVKWLDACSPAGDQPVNSVKNISPLERDNVGFLLNDQPDYIVISFGFIKQADYVQSDETKTIVRGMITQLIPLKEG